MGGFWAQCPPFGLPGVCWPPGAPRNPHVISELSPDPVVTPLALLLFPVHEQGLFIPILWLSAKSVCLRRLCPSSQQILFFVVSTPFPFQKFFFPHSWGTGVNISLICKSGCLCPNCYFASRKGLLTFQTFS